MGPTTRVRVSDLWLPSRVQNGCKPTAADQVEERGSGGKEGALSSTRVSDRRRIEGPRVSDLPRSSPRVSDRTDESPFIYLDNEDDFEVCSDVTSQGKKSDSIWFQFPKRASR